MRLLGTRRDDIADGVYFDDPSEALEYLRSKSLPKKLTGGSIVEFRPCSLPMGPQMLGRRGRRRATGWTCR